MTIQNLKVNLISTSRKYQLLIHSFMTTFNRTKNFQCSPYCLITWTKSAVCVQFAVKSFSGSGKRRTPIFTTAPFIWNSKTTSVRSVTNVLVNVVRGRDTSTPVHDVEADFYSSVYCIDVIDFLKVPVIWFSSSYMWEIVNDVKHVKTQILGFFLTLATYCYPFFVRLKLE